MPQRQGVSVAHDLREGVTALTALGRAASVPLNVLESMAKALVEDPNADAYVLASGGHGPVLTCPSTTLLIQASDLTLLPQWLLEEIAGAGRRGDAVTALMDVQWRLNLWGRRVVRVDGGVEDVSPTDPEACRRRMQGLLTLLETNLSDELRGAILPVAQIALLSGSLREGEADTAALDLQRSPGGDGEGSLTLATSALSGAWAIDAALDALEYQLQARERLQASRRVNDVYLLPLIRSALPTLLGKGLVANNEDLIHSLLQTFSVPHLLDRTPVIHRVTIASNRTVKREIDSPHSSVGGDADTGNPDALIVSGGLPAEAEIVVPDSVPLLIDISEVDLMSWLLEAKPLENRAAALATACARADRVLVKDDEQRDFLLGALAGEKRVNGFVYDDDPSLRALVEVKNAQSVESFEIYAVRAADVLSSVLEKDDEPANRLDAVVKYVRDMGIAGAVTRAFGSMQRNSSNQGGC